MDTFQYLLKLPKTAIIAFISKTGNRIALYPSINVLGTLSSLKTKYLNHDLPDKLIEDIQNDNISLVFLYSDISNKVQIYNHLAYLSYKEYKEKSYEFYFIPKYSIFKTKIQNAGNDKVNIVLMSSRKNTYTISRIPVDDAISYLEQKSILDLLLIAIKT